MRTRSEIAGAVVPLTYIVQFVKIFVVVVGVVRAGVRVGFRAGAVVVELSVGTGEVLREVSVHENVASLVGSCCRGGWVVVAAEGALWSSECGAVSFREVSGVFVVIRTVVVEVVSMMDPGCE